MLFYTVTLVYKILAPSKAPSSKLAHRFNCKHKPTVGRKPRQLKEM